MATTVFVDERLKELIPFFMKETFSDFDRLQSFAEQQDYEALKALAHTLKGESGGYGFTCLGDLAKALEQAALSQNIKEVDSLIQQMRDHLESVEIEYEKVA